MTLGWEIRNELNAEAALDEAREERLMQESGYFPVYEDTVETGETIVPNTRTPVWNVGGAVVTDNPVEVIDVVETTWRNRYTGKKRRGRFDEVIVPVRGGEQRVSCEKIRRHECGQLVNYGTLCPCEAECDSDYDHEQASLVDYAERGMMCDECGASHNDWSKDGEYAIDDGECHAGIIEVVECLWCGIEVEVGRR